MLAYMVHVTDKQLGTQLLTKVSNAIEKHEPFTMDISMLEDLCVVQSRIIYADELQDSLSDFVFWLDARATKLRSDVVAKLQ